MKKYEWGWRVERWGLYNSTMVVVFHKAAQQGWRLSKAGSTWGKFNRESQVPMVHTCNPTYSGSRDQEAHGSKPALGKQLTRPYLNNTTYKKGLVEWLRQ
jgi:hypothetical protein